MPSTVIQYFEYAHLPPGPMREVSEKIAALAHVLETQVQDSPEKSAGMRKLLEAKDCLVRAAIPPAITRAERQQTDTSTADEEEPHDIGWAVAQLRSGCVRRRGWNGKGMWLGLVRPSESSVMSLPYVYMKTADNKRVPWLCSQTDLLATDWEAA